MLPLLFLLLLLNHLSASTAADSPLLDYVCSGTNFTANDSFDSNLNTLLSSLSSNSTFTTSTSGSSPNKAYALFLCRSDVSSSDCKSCIKTATQDILSLCQERKQGIIWYDNCELRYSDSSFFSVVDESEYTILINKANAMDVDSFVKMQTELLDTVTYRAAYNSSMKFATGVAYNGSKDMLYALAQCTRDLSADACNRCLKQIRGYYEYEMSVGGRVVGQSCNFRYEQEVFFGGEPMISLDLSGPVPTPAAAPPAKPHVGGDSAPVAEMPASSHGGRGDNIPMNQCTLKNFTGNCCVYPT